MRKNGHINSTSTLSSGKHMSWFKRMLLGLIILAGLIGTLKDYKDFGLFGALGLFIIFLLSTTFLWQWASGNGCLAVYSRKRVSRFKRRQI